MDSASDSDGVCNVSCQKDADCEQPTNLCVLMPGDSEGYCSIPCAASVDCVFEDWACNVAGSCEAPFAAWCGPPEEVEDYGGLVKTCP